MASTIQKKKPYRKPKQDQPLVVIAVGLGLILFSCNNMKSEQQAAIAKAEECNKADAWQSANYVNDCVYNPELTSTRNMYSDRLEFEAR
jgi:hypothetical protein